MLLSKMRALLLYLLMCLCLSLQAQKQNTFWYFGDSAALDFSGGNPVGIKGSGMSIWEGCASVSDDNGRLLFYSDGRNIWDARNKVMPNGSGLMAGRYGSCTQGPMIVPYPDHSGKYILFTVEENEADTGRVCYSIVNMSLNNGFGDIEAGNKNIEIADSASERLAAAPIGDGSGFWIMTHEAGSSQFKAYRLTTAGIDTQPVISNIGMVHRKTTSDVIGYMKFNQKYSRLAVVLGGSQTAEVLDFDRCTGKLSNVFSVGELSTAGLLYGLEFSPDGSKLYIAAAMSGNIFQVDLSAGDTSAIQQSVYKIVMAENNGCALQLGPDGRIYISLLYRDYLGCIASPDASGADCNFIEKAVMLAPNSTCSYGLPHTVPALQNKILYSVKDIQVNDTCYGQMTSFSLPGHTGVANINWDFGDPVSGSANTAVSASPQHLFSGKDTFTVSVRVFANCSDIELKRPVIISDCEACNQFFVPNAFTPNGDYINETFSPLIPCTAAEYHMSIYSRWGELLFTTDDTTVAWDGVYRGTPCSEGAYLCQISYRFNGKPVLYNKGMVQLLR